MKAITTLRQPRNLSLIHLTAAALVVAMTTTAFAGTDKTFTTAYTTLSNWAQGSLGKILALSAFLIGLAMGIARQSLIAVAMGIAFALVLFYGPTIIDSIMTFAV